jgi:hypothetical protein
MSRVFLSTAVIVATMLTVWAAPAMPGAVSTTADLVWAPAGEIRAAAKANPAVISNLAIRQLLLASGNDGIESDCNASA